MDSKESSSATATTAAVTAPFPSLDELRRRYASDKLYHAIVDLYRNVSWEPEPFCFYMAVYDLITYAEDGANKAGLLTLYDERELEFLVNRGVKLM